MVSLIDHHRLLGFVAMMDEPLHHLKIKPQPPGQLSTQFTVVDVSAVRGEGVLAPGRILSYKSPPLTFGALKGKYDKVYFVAHGFQEKYEGKYLNLVHDLLKYKQQEKPAVFVVHWNEGAQYNMRTSASYPELNEPIYGQAVANTVVVGREVALMTYYLTKQGIIKRQDVHYIGLGLGAQVMHIAGQWYTHLEDVDRENLGGPRSGGKIGRITGLDPSARDFQGYGSITKLPYLNDRDADFVDIIHTSSVRNGGNKQDITNNRLGLSVLAGHVDFYPNGGQEQPFCKSTPKCSHERSLHYFRASLTTNSTVTKGLFSFSANTYEEYLDIRPAGRPTNFKYLFKKKEQVSSKSETCYMGIQASVEALQITDQPRRGYFSDFALDSNMKFAVVLAAGRSELQLMDTLKPVIKTKEGYDFTKFPVHMPTKTPTLHELELPGCGRFLAPPVVGRVHRGLEPYAKQFPWNVCIVMVTNTPRGTMIYAACTGTLISDNFVVTAAHCFADYALNKKGHPKLRRDNRPIYLMFGSDCQRPLLYQEIPAIQGGTALDIALIKLKSPIPAAMLPQNGQFTNETVLNTACWRTATVFDYNDICEELYFAGYGLNHVFPNIRSDLLRWTVMKINSNRARMVVAINAEHHKTRNTCPLPVGLAQLYDKVSPYTAIIVGTVVGGPSPCTREGKYTVFCKVGQQAVYSWIDATLANNAGPLKGDLTVGPIDYGVEHYLQNF
ncbi:Pancreatic lipase-related protein 2 [Halotydeus destructor]|nr:Pancreatic lipase-related protein 2 [Halotydeus destructor]